MEFQHGAIDGRPQFGEQQLSFEFLKFSPGLIAIPLKFEQVRLAIVELPAGDGSGATQLAVATDVTGLYLQSGVKVAKASLN
jgi:hypothetical protein